MVRPSPAIVRRRLTVTGRSGAVLILVCATTLLFEVIAPASAWAERTPVPLGSAAAFAVLAGTTITNTGAATAITGDVGVHPGTAVTGLTAGQVSGTIHAGDSAAAQAKADLDTAYGNSAARNITQTLADPLTGTVQTGVYDSVSDTFEIAADVTLDAQGDPNAVFIFKADSSLVTAANSTVTLINGAQSCNVFWQVGTTATLGAASTLRGNVLAVTWITVGTGARVDGRVMARDGAVTMDTTIVDRSPCATPGALSITAPAGPVSLGAGVPGGTVSGNLGAVTVTDERLLSSSSWIATVVATDFVITATPARIVAQANASYLSGTATSTTGFGIFTAGQLTPQSLGEQRTAYTLTEGIGNTSATWDPWVSVQVPLSTVAGAYIGTLTFSVA